jgi:hypothetical protein
MANQRALRLKQHAAEFESKKEDLRRLRGALEKFATEATFSKYSAGLPIKKTLAPYRQFLLEVEVREIVYERAIRTIQIRLIAAGSLIEKDSQLHLEIVRLAHDNMDGIIEAVEEFCRKAGCSAQLQAHFQRFLV